MGNLFNIVLLVAARVLSPITPTVLAELRTTGAPIGATRAKNNRNF